MEYKDETKIVGTILKNWRKRMHEMTVHRKIETIQNAEQLRGQVNRKTKLISTIKKIYVITN